MTAEATRDLEQINQQKKNKEAGVQTAGARALKLRPNFGKLRNRAQIPRRSADGEREVGKTAAAAVTAAAVAAAVAAAAAAVATSVARRRLLRRLSKFRAESRAVPAGIAEEGAAA